MKHQLIRLGLAAAVALVLAPSSARAQISPAEIWPQATAVLDTGDVAAAQQKLDQMLELGKGLGVSRFPLFAESAASLARQLYKSGNKQGGDWAIAAAHKLDPQSPTVAFTTADIAFDRSDYVGAIKALSGGVVDTLTEPTARVVARADLISVIAIAITGTAALFGLALFFRYSRPAAHDFRELFGTRMGAGLASVIALAALALPLFLWLGPTWVLIYWFALFFGYASLGERIATVVLLVLLSLIPIALDWSVYRVVGSSSPIVRAAQANVDNIYHPETLRRMRELVEVAADEPRLQLLLGGLELQIGDEQSASIHYREAIKLDPKLGGAQVNLGNLDFFHNEFRAAITKYEKAIEVDPKLAIAYFNISAASGEIYDYARQGQMLEQARTLDRALIQQYIATPPTQKVVMYDLPVDEAWELSERLTRKGVAREMFGNYARFDLATSAANPLTLACILGIIAGPAVWFARRGKGFAGSCMKCGRTFCHRCKSARESATYCTQCIHIYLKRDGVSLDTKQNKLNEVHRYQSGQVRLKKILATFFPGSGQIVDGSPGLGLVYVFLFLLFLSIAILVGNLVPIATPAWLMRITLRTVALLFAIVTWVLVSIPVYRQKPVF